MNKKNELQLGHLVRFGDIESKVTGILHTKIYLESGIECKEHELEPINLDVKHLELLGFKLINEHYIKKSNNKHQFIVEESSYGFTWFFDFMLQYKGIKYVHELQTIYQILMGESL